MWSPDGRTIAFSEDRAGPAKQTISLMRADGTRIRTITPRTNVSWNPSWSPDGKRIAYDSNRAYGGVARLRRDIYTIDVDGSNLRRLAVRGSRWHSAIDPDWSPDGTRIAFNTSNAEGIGDKFSGIYVMRSGGGRVTRLTRPALGAGWDRHPAWSPDGRRILFDRTVRRVMYVIHVATRRLRELPTSASDEFSFPSDAVWSPDGRRIAFVDLDVIYVSRSDGTGRVEVLRSQRGICCLDWKPASR